MVIPAAGTIEMAVDSLKNVDQEHKDRQLKELHSAMGAAHLSSVEDGYLLGLQTARVFLAGNPAAVMAKVIF